MICSWRVSSVVTDMLTRSSWLSIRTPRRRHQSLVVAGRWMPTPFRSSIAPGGTARGADPFGDLASVELPNHEVCHNSKNVRELETSLRHATAALPCFSTRDRSLLCFKDRIADFTLPNTLPAAPKSAS